MNSSVTRLLSALVLCLMTATANASFVIEPDVDGADDGPFTPSPNFSFGGDTTTASTSIAVGGGPTPVSGPLVGTTGGDSIFGGDGVSMPDTYLYTYTPGTDGDNTSIAGGTALNDDGDVASGLAAGGSGTYRIYATWPQSQNVSGGDGNGGLILYALSDGNTDIATSNEIQNEDVDLNIWPNSVAAGVPQGSLGVDGNLKGNEWEFLFEVQLDAGTTYVLRQQPTAANSFVSMRSGGVLFDYVPEPTAALLALFGATYCLLVRRRE